MTSGTYPRCKGPLIAIGRNGERLCGCIQCNRWKWRPSERVLIELPDEDVTRCVSRFGLATGNATEIGTDGGEHGIEFGADCRDCAYDDNRNEPRNEAVLHCRDARLVLQQTHEQSLHLALR